MIAGNVCMNRMHGIIYPAFQIASSNGGVLSQDIPVVAKMDATASLNTDIVQVDKDGVGINTIGALSKASQDKMS
jgi:hypothetical protein